MSRPTDIERGARMALDVADAQFRQLDFFPNLDADFWASICLAASDQLHECRAYREALRG